MKNKKKFINMAEVRWSNYRKYWIDELAKFKGDDKGFMNFAINFKTSTIKAQVMDLRKQKREKNL